jgi:hypothetical protein
MSLTYVEKHRVAGGRTEQALLKMSWEGEPFGVGLLEEPAEKYPDHAKEFTACATMEWFNIHCCEPFGHDAGIHVTLEQAEKLRREGTAMARHLRSFEAVAKVTIEETGEADELYKQLIKARAPRTEGPRGGLA